VESQEIREGRVVIVSLVNQRLKGRRRNNESESSALASSDTAGTKCNKIKGSKSVRLGFLR
jgi:hypothetical protein